MKFINSLKKSQTANQAGLLLLATVSNIITQIVINALLARSLSQEEYGNYSYFINIFTFCQTVFNFGFFYTICRLISISKSNQEVRAYYYEGLKYLLILSVLMILVLYTYSFIELGDLKRNGIEKIFWIIAPLSCVYLITNFNEQIFQGNNKITELSVSRAVPKLLYSILVIILFLSKVKISILPYLIAYLCSHLIVYSFLIRWIKPFKGKQSNFKNIFFRNREFGLNIYFGSLLSVGVANLMGILISNSCLNNVILGYYNIALQVTTPLTMIPNILSTVLFSRFSKNGNLPKKLVMYVAIISIGLYATLYFASDFIIRVIFGENYLPASNLIKILGFGNVLYGIGDFFNRYVLARGKAVAIRNIAITVGIVYLAIGVTIIPMYKAIGASYAKVIAGLLYLSLEITYTKRLITREKLKSGNS